MKKLEERFNFKNLTTFTVKAKLLEDATDDLLQELDEGLDELAFGAIRESTVEQSEGKALVLIGGQELAYIPGKIGKEWAKVAGQIFDISPHLLIECQALILRSGERARVLLALPNLEEVEDQLDKAVRLHG